MSKEGTEGGPPDPPARASEMVEEPGDDEVDDSLILWMLGLTCEQRLQAAQDLADAAWRLSLGDDPER